MKLYVKFGKQETVRLFLEKFFSCHQPYDDYVRGTATYDDEECTKLHCPEGKLRSFDDIFDLVNTYYDNISVKELIHTLATLDVKRNGNELFMHTGTCSGIRRIRMLYVPKQTIPPDMYTDKYDSKYSWKELFSMIGITSREKLIEYKTKNHEKISFD